MRLSAMIVYSVALIITGMEDVSLHICNVLWMRHREKNTHAHSRDDTHAHSRDEAQVITEDT